MFVKKIFFLIFSSFFFLSSNNIIGSPLPKVKPYALVIEQHGTDIPFIIYDKTFDEAKLLYYQINNLGLSQIKSIYMINLKESRNCRDAHYNSSFPT